MKAWHCIATVPAFFIRRPDDGQTAKYVSVRASFADMIASYSRKQGFDDALQTMYSRKQGFDDAMQACIVEKEASTMHCKQCIVAKEASTVHCKRCIVENKASTTMLLHCASRKRKSGRVVATPPLRTFKNLTNYFFSLNISWQAFQS